MLNISSFLNKFKKEIENIEHNKEKILDILLKVSQTQINKEDIDYKNGVITIKSSPAIKNKIFIYKEKIISEIEKETKLKITNIK